ncbi:hypothetical protein NQ315_008460 [Exocentrus adspersus]|uniref:Uncharacterized protein n=1 Tax=Exocentrus adspersus TaxID=1586481 RepID=A0AAV8W5V7_9CUCU|nr:hypothetical protein NQ315_008460 [Exocentrus adspersus]
MIDNISLVNSTDTYLQKIILIVASVTGCFGVMKNVNLSKNLLTTLQNSSCNDDNSNIDTLDLSDNMLSNLGDVSEMKDFVTILTKLKVISLEGNNFTCDTLLQIFHHLRDVTIIRGHSFNTSNIHGIACSESISSPQPDLDIRVTSGETLEKSLNNDFTKSSIYLENFKYVGSLVTNYSKVLDNVKNIQKLQDDFNKSIQGYFNNSFLNSSFVRYLENFKKNEDALNENFTQSFMYNYFNKNFLSSSFYKYLEGLKKPQFIVKYSGDANNTKVEKLVVSTLTNAEDTKDDSALLVVIVVLLVVIACIMLGAMYAILFKFGTLLKTFYINNNQIRTFDSEYVLMDLPNLKVISLEGNNFTCDTLRNIFDDLKNITIIKGYSFNTSNIQGIACSETSNSNWDTRFKRGFQKQ